MVDSDVYNTPISLRVLGSELPDPLSFIASVNHLCDSMRVAPQP